MQCALIRAFTVLTCFVAKVVRDLQRSQEQSKQLQAENESLNTEIEVLRQRLKASDDHLPPVEPKGMVQTT